MTADPKKVRVLVVDDEPSLLRALPLVLSEFQVTVAASAAEAMRLLAQASVDVALVDYGMAPVNGVDLLREIASAYPSVRRYMISGFNPSTFADQVAEGLILRLFVKPVDIPTLKALLAGEH